VSRRIGSTGALCGLTVMLEQKRSIVVENTHLGLTTTELARKYGIGKGARPDPLILAAGWTGQAAPR
jgi:hypothetical protein